MSSRRLSGDIFRPRRFSAPPHDLRRNANNTAALSKNHQQQRLISSLGRIAAEQYRTRPLSSVKGEINTLLAEESLLQREMLKDPRFGSPLLCDTLVMLTALLPLGCGFTAYFSGTGNMGASAGYNYGLALCGIFIFLLGLRSASLHLINQIDTTEDRVRYILDKFGGSVCIPRSPEVRRLYSSDAMPATAPGQHSSLTEEPFRVVMNPGSSSVYLLSDRRSAIRGRLSVDPLTRSTVHHV